jgi:hypothetical protein
LLAGISTHDENSIRDVINWNDIKYSFTITVNILQ